MPAHTISPSKSSFAWRQILRRTTTRFVGIDIGSREVRVSSVGSSNADRYNVLQWDSRSRFELPIDPLRPPTTDLVDLVCDSLIEHLPRCVDGDRDFAAVSLPPSWIHYETASGNELDAVQTSCDAMFEKSVFRSAAHLCHWPICEDKPLSVVAATAESAACRVAQAVDEVGYEVTTMLPHGVALIQSAAATCSVDPSAVVFLDVDGGIVATNNEGRCGHCRALPGFDEGTRAFDVDQLEPYLKLIADEVLATIRYVNRQSRQPATRQPILLCGDLAKTEGVDKLLATLTGLPVATWRYSRRNRPVGPNDPPDDVGFHDPSRAVSLSLAFCAADKMGKFA